jgi:hypothetical protein
LAKIPFGRWTSNSPPSRAPGALHPNEPIAQQPDHGSPFGDCGMTDPVTPAYC